jgi:hypothetical protein
MVDWTIVNKPDAGYNKPDAGYRDKEFAGRGTVMN